MYISTTFELTADGPPSIVVPLFGADRERVWAEGWAPRFIHPSPAADRPGMVFAVGDATWINTRFDVAAGDIQYAYVVPDAMTALISIRATARGDATHVVVTYERTSLTPAADERVRALAEQDRSAGPAWARETNAYLASA